MEENDLDDYPTPIVRLPQAHEYAELLPKFDVEHSSEFSVANLMNMQNVYG